MAQLVTKPPRSGIEKRASSWKRKTNMAVPWAAAKNSRCCLKKKKDSMNAFFHHSKQMVTTIAPNNKWSVLPTCFVFFCLALVRVLAPVLGLQNTQKQNSWGPRVMDPSFSRFVTTQIRP